MSATYLYTCPKCLTIELLFKLGSAPQSTNCPTCNQEIHRQYSPIGNIVKCSGFFGKNK